MTPWEKARLRAEEKERERLAALPRQQRRFAERKGGRAVNSCLPRSASIAEGNRHGGPHLHKREIARRTITRPAKGD